MGMLRFGNYYLKELSHLLFLTKQTKATLYNPIYCTLYLHDLHATSTANLFPQSTLTALKNWPLVNNFPAINSTNFSTSALPNPLEYLSTFNLFKQISLQKTLSLNTVSNVSAKRSKTHFIDLKQKYQKGLLFQLGTASLLFGLRELYSLKEKAYVDLIDWQKNKKLFSFTIPKPLFPNRSFLMLSPKNILAILINSFTSDVIELYKVTTKNCKKFFTVNLDRCSCFDIDPNNSVLFSCHSNYLSIGELYKPMDRKTFKILNTNEIQAVKYVEECRMLFIASDKVEGYSVSEDNREIHQAMLLDTENEYISKLEYDNDLNMLYAFTFNSGIFAWKIINGFAVLYSKVRNNFKSLFPMVINSFSKSVIINKDYRELHQVSISKKKSSKWDDIQGTLLGFDAKTRTLVLQKS